MLNSVTLMGRLTADPELKHTTSDIALVRFSLAVDRDYNKSGTERQTDFINIVAWRSTAEFVSKYFRKGQLVAVKGSIQTGSYTDNNGNKRYTFDVVADNVYFAEGKRDNSGTPSTYDNQSRTNDSTAAYSSGSASDFGDMPTDDDLPF
ncbi:MAG: single-stranded DNA-binding protein [Acutalibacteraceae bacterium]